jgi:hypothetical protein
MKNLFLLIILLSGIALNAQVTSEATPPSWNIALFNKSNATLKEIMPSIEIERLKKEDFANDGLRMKPYRFGEKIPVDFNLFNSGKWTVLPSGDRIWRINIESTGAKTINFLFDQYNLPEGAELFIYNDEHTDRIGPYTSSENQENGVLGSWIIRGDNVWIEYYEPDSVKNLGRISIDKVVHGYRGFSSIHDESKRLNDSGDCNVDVQCNPNVGSTNSIDWSTIRDNYRQAVAIILVNGNDFCTGTLINNVRGDGTPYLYSANHCLSVNDGQAPNLNLSSLSFGFEWFSTTPQCATNVNTAGPSQSSQVISGATGLMNHSNSDTALLLLNQTPPSGWNLYYAGWDRTLNIPSAQLGIHHPSGDIMKIARNDQPVLATPVTIGGSTAQTWRVADWDYGVTERGSSGSVLVNPEGRIIGELFGGSAGCNMPGFGDTTDDNNAPDYYGRFNVAWQGGGTSATQLKIWLDPENTSVFTLDGVFPNQTAGLQDVANSIDVKIYPNPSRGMFTIESDLPTTFQVYNLNGQVILNGSTRAAGDQLDLTGVADGLYFVKIAVGEETITRKLIKQ